MTLSFEGENVKVFPADYTAALSLVPTDGELVPTLDAAKLSEVVGSKVTQGAPVDATVTVVDGTPQVVPAKPGVTFDEQQLEAGFLETVAKPLGERTLALTAKVAQPAFTTKDARALKIREQVSTFTTYFPYAEYRNVNLGRAAELIDGTVLEPGETFSLNGTVGERTEANGFTKGYVISDGILIQDLGGGVSQIATTTFNAMFFAGLEDVEHKPHSFYIDRYPIGREATVAWGAVDLQFRNDTPYGVLIEASVTPSTPTTSGSATVSMYSTRYWDITTTTGERHNLTQAKVRRIDDLTCHANEGYGGFDIDVVRYFTPVNGNTETRDDEVFEHDLHAQRHGHLHQPRRRRRVVVDGAVRRTVGRDYGVSRCRSRGNSVTSRTLAAPTSRATQRSSPIAKPPCGGMPCRNASRYAVVRRRVLAARPDGADVVARARCSRWPPVTSSSPRKSRSKLFDQRASPGLRVGVERPLRHRVAVDEHEVAAVLGQRPLAEGPLVLGGEVGLVGGCAHQREGVGEVDHRDLLGHDRRPGAGRGSASAGSMAGDHPGQHLAEHRHHVAVVVDEAELDVERAVLGEVAHGVVRLGAEHRPDLVDPLEDADQLLLVELRALGEVGRAAEVVDREDRRHRTPSPSRRSSGCGPR